MSRRSSRRRWCCSSWRFRSSGASGAGSSAAEASEVWAKAASEPVTKTEEGTPRRNRRARVTEKAQMADDASLPRVNPVDYYLLRDEDFLDLLSVAFAADAERVSNTGQLALITWGRLCAEVANGGFTQFFYNYGEVGVEEVVEMLDALEVPKIGELLRQALAIYREHQPEFQVENPWEGFFGSIKAFDPLDREFVKSTRLANKALEKWTRAHVDLIAVGRG